MQAAVTVDAERRFLRFRFAQGATVTDWVEARAVFLRLSAETGIRRALVDIRAQRATGPMMELYEFGERIPSGMAFAVLTHPPADDPKFVETVALNRGKSVRLFFGPEDEAITWLMAEAS